MEGTVVRQILKSSIAALGLAAMAATAANGQTVLKQFPPGLKWATMSVVALNLNAPEFPSTPAERELAWSIWKTTIESFPAGGPGGKWPAFVMLKAFESKTKRYVFSSLSAAAVAYPQCEDARNSKEPTTPIYTICPMRVVVEDKASGQSTRLDFPRFCNIFANDSDNPRSRNYGQVAISPDGKTAYFRVVQYGKPAPECNRAISLG